MVAGKQESGKVVSTVPPVRVLHVATRLDAAGTVFGVMSLAERCLEQGYQTAVLARRGSLTEECSRRGIPVFDCEGDLPRSRFSRWLPSSSSAAKAAEFAPHVFHFHGTELDRVATRLCRWLKLPYVLTFDGFYNRRHRIVFSRKWCRGIIAPNESMREDLVNQARVPKDRVKVIPVGVRLSDYEVCSKKRNNGLTPIVGTFWQRLPSKGVGQLLRAARLVLDAGVEAQFLVSGEGRNLRELKVLSRELGLDRCVTFPGAVSDHRAVFSAMDIFVAPSTEEDSSLTILEAMASGLPVVATSVGSTYQVVQDEKTGCLVRPGVVQALADAILVLLRDRSRRAELGQRARQFVAEQHDAERTADRVIALYEATTKLAEENETIT